MADRQTGAGNESFGLIKRVKVAGPRQKTGSEQA